MKKIFLLVLLLLMAAIPAEGSYTSVLYRELKENEGLFFAYKAKFGSGEELITVSENKAELKVRALKENDGDEVTDELEIVTGGGNVYELSVVSAGEEEFILLETNGVKELYTVRDDSFVREKLRDYRTVTKIVRRADGKTDTYGNTRGGAYNLLNEMKKEQINAYSFINRRNSMTEEELRLLRNVTAAAADIMSYDSRDYDFDKLMRYILNTHENFRELVPVDKGEYGDGGVGLVKAEYIDYIVKELFGLEPQHPPVNELISRGYCVNNGYYNYTEAFDVNFSTEMRDIEAVYEAGNNVYLVIFGDIYTEEGVSVPEYSYMILRAVDGGFRILRINMGGELPDEHTVMEYAGRQERRKFFWERNSDSDNYKDDNVAGWVLFAGVAVILAVVIWRAVKRF